METVVSRPGPRAASSDPQRNEAPQSVELVLRGPLDKGALLDALRHLPARHLCLETGSGEVETAGVGAGRTQRIEGRACLEGLDDGVIGGLLESDKGCINESIHLGELLSAEISNHSADVHGLILSWQGDGLSPEALGLILKDIGYLYSCRVLGVRAEPPATFFGSTPPSPPRHPEEDRVASSLAARSDSLVQEAAPRALDLPVDRPGQKGDGALVKSVDFVMNGPLSSEVSRFAIDEEVSEVAVHIAAFDILLARLSGAIPVTIGLHPSELSALQGVLLVDPLRSLVPLTTEVRMNLTGSQLVRAVQAGMDKLSSDLAVSVSSLGDPSSESARVSAPQDPGWGASRHASFRFSASLPAECVEFLGLSVEFRLGNGEATEREPQLRLLVSGSGTLVRWNYDQRELDAGTMHHWMGSYGAILESLVEEGASPLGLLQVVTNEQMSLLSEWNATRAQGEFRQPFLHQLFSENAQRAPGMPATTSASGEISSYGQLDALSNQLARELQAWGAGRNVRVGVLLERNFDLLVVHLATLKSGATCVPFDCRDGALDEIIALAEVSFIVSHSSLLSHLEKASERTLLLDVAAGQIARQSVTELPPVTLQAASGDIAYVIFEGQAGSERLGVLVSHRALLACVKGLLVRPGLNAADRVVAFADDETLLLPVEPLAALCAGAQVVLGAGAASQDGRAMKSLLESADASFMVAGHQTWQRLRAAGWVGAAGFKALVPAAQLNRSLANQLLDKAVEPWVFYRTPGVAGWAACDRILDSNVLPEQGGRFKSRPVGKPVENTSVWVLDEHGAVCPIGAFGDLHIGGSCLADGYFNKLGRAAESFIPDLVGRHQGQKLYLTGDRGRWCHDGSLECLLRDQIPHEVAGYAGSEPVSHAPAAPPVRHAPAGSGTEARDEGPPAAPPSVAEPSWFVDSRVAPVNDDDVEALGFEADALPKPRKGRSAAALVAVSLAAILTFSAFWTAAFRPQPGPSGSPAPSADVAPGSKATSVAGSSSDPQPQALPTGSAMRQPPLVNGASDAVSPPPSVAAQLREHERQPSAKPALPTAAANEGRPSSTTATNDARPGITAPIAATPSIASPSAAAPGVAAPTVAAPSVAGPNVVGSSVAEVSVAAPSISMPPNALPVGAPPISATPINRTPGNATPTTVTPPSSAPIAAEPVATGTVRTDPVRTEPVRTDPVRAAAAEPAAAPAAPVLVSVPPQPRAERQDGLSPGPSQLNGAPAETAKASTPKRDGDNAARCEPALKALGLCKRDAP